MTFTPVRSSHSGIHLLKRNDAVAETDFTTYSPSSVTVAAGAQWKLTLDSDDHGTGGSMPSARNR